LGVYADEPVEPVVFIIPSLMALLFSELQMFEGEKIHREREAHRQVEAGFPKAR
jgi:hypothetical protein